MLEARAVVVRADSGLAWVEARHDVSGCGTCQGKGCGSSKLSQMFCSNKKREFSVENPISAQVGDEVVIAIRDGAVWQGVKLVYVWPLAGLLAGSMAGFWLGAGDAAAALGALVGLLAGLSFARWGNESRRLAGGQPYIARRWQGS